jgi:hypothetical protein
VKAERKELGDNGGKRRERSINNNIVLFPSTHTQYVLDVIDIGPFQIMEIHPFGGRDLPFILSTCN